MSDTPARAGGRRDLAYRLTWNAREPAAGANARCINLFTGPGGVPGANAIPGVTRYVIDFSGDVLAGLDRSSGVDAITDLPAQDVLLKVVGPVSGLDRVARHHGCAHQGLAQKDFRLFLKRGAAALSETLIATVKS
jgi:glucans biosynthesis protein